MVFRMHGDLRVVQQILMDDVQGMNDASKDGSSVLGKYIMGAKNNFRGFSSKQDDSNTPLKVTVHHRGEDTDKDVRADVEGGSECGRQGSDCDVVKMEEGRAKSNLGVRGETESEEEVEADRKANTDNEENEEVGAGASSVQAEVKLETTADEENRGGKIPPGQTGGTNRAEKSTKKSPNVKSTVTMFKDLELQKTQTQTQWEKDRNTEHHFMRKSVSESEKRPGTEKNIPSPSDSSSSQDTGFGSQEGEGSIDGVKADQ